jgi:hypothetical protein
MIRPHSFGIQLATNIALVALLLVVASLITSGSGLVAAILAVCSFQFARKAVDRPFLSGLLPGVIAANILQIGYFVSAMEMYPLATSNGVVLLNATVITVLSAVCAGIATYLRRKRQTTEQQKKEQERIHKKRFSDTLSRITVLTLFCFLSVHIWIPFTASVAAVAVEKETYTPDTFIDNYDPDKTYESGGESVVENPKRRIPLYGVPEASEYAYLTPEEIEAIKTHCEQAGCNPAELMEQLNNEKQMPTLTPEQLQPETLQREELIGQVKEGKLSYKDIEQMQRDGTLTDGQAAELVWEGVKSGKISAWDGAKHLGGGLKKAGDALWNTVTEPVKQAWNYAKENPWQAAAIVAGAVAVTAAIVLFPPAAAFAGAALTYGAQAAAVWTAGNLAYAYATGGTDGLAQKMFSSETRQLWASGDVWGAIGKGTADIGVQTMALLPLATVPKTIAALPKAGVAIVNGVNNLKNFRNLAGSLSNIRVTVAITDSSGILNNGGMQIVKNAIQKGAQYGSGVVDEIGIFIKGLSKDKLAVAALNKQGEVVEQAAGVSNGAGKAAVSQGADEVVQVNREAHNAAKFDKYVRELRAARDMPQVDDVKLQKQIKEHYRDTAEIGSGSSADALRNELKTGQPTKGKHHMQKVQDSLIYFKNWKKSNPNASKKDVEAVDDMIKDLEDALGYN